MGRETLVNLQSAGRRFPVRASTGMTRAVLAASSSVHVGGGPETFGVRIGEIGTRGVPMTPLVPPLDPSTAAWVDAVIVAGGAVSSQRMVLVDDLILSLKSKGLWDLIDRIWLLAAENAQSALIDLKNRGVATPVNGPTFTADRGYAGNGTSSYLNSGFVPATNGVALTQNSAHLLAYDRTDRTATTGFPYLIGYSNAVGSLGILASAGFSLGARVNQAASGEWAAPLANAQGCHVAVRRGATAADGSIYLNGVPQTVSAGSVSNGLGAGSVYIGSMNGAGGTATSDQIAAISIGGALTDQQAADLTSDINTYMIAVGAAVF